MHIQIYCGAEVSHTNRCRSVGTLRHWCQSVRQHQAPGHFGTKL